MSRVRAAIAYRALSTLGVIRALDADSDAEQFLEQLGRSLAITVCPGGVLVPDTQYVVEVGPVHPGEATDEFGEPVHRIGVHAGLAELDGGLQPNLQVSRWSAPSRAAQSSSSSANIRLAASGSDPRRPGRALRSPDGREPTHVSALCRGVAGPPWWGEPL